MSEISAEARDGPCSLGVGCDETGVCYAMAHDRPEQCGRPSALVLALQQQDEIARERDEARNQITELVDDLKRCAEHRCAFEARALAAEARCEKLEGAVEQLVAFVSIMVGVGPNCRIPEEIVTPIGVPVKVGKIIREANEALADQPGGE